MTKNLSACEIEYEVDFATAVQLRFFSFLAALLCFLDAGVRLPSIAAEYWRPIGPVGPILDFLFTTYGPGLLIQVQDVSRYAIYIGLVLAAFGVRTRLSSTVAAIATVVFFSIFASARGMRHSDPPLILSILLAALTPWPNKGEQPRTVNLWPVHFQRFLLVFVFMSAGFEKLYGNPSGWLTGATVATTLKWVQLGYAHRSVPEIQLAANGLISQLPSALLTAAGVFVIILELAVPLLLYAKRTQRIAYLALLSLMIIFRLILFVPFSGFYALFAYWLPRFNPHPSSATKIDSTSP